MDLAGKHSLFYLIILNMIHEYFLKVFGIPIYILMVSFNTQKFYILIMPS